MMAELYSRRIGRYNLMKESLAIWCTTAKKGQKILLVSMRGNYVLQFMGSAKTRNSLTFQFDEK